ncbi:short-chain fatty acid transporter [Shewanella surugensis]|uniref:Short-chain fatty acid transporter n=1 Tax=Shewanella surugensis TaxID=212020 RepID=A0ABT0LCD3_9GAMM|nr:short-chain fatty acid transporter [Shewanella surugensis]MCL1125347.1 short-chain fatty acid transporter [Shewanella surugensis]
MLTNAARPLVKLVDRYLPDPYIFVLILSLVVIIAAIVFEQKSLIEVIEYWGNGFWGLLTFSMQMLLVLIVGFILASSPLIKKGLNGIACLAKTAPQAILLVTFVSLFASWINWGFGLVVGVLFAKALARKVKVDYRLLIASVYSGFLVWHGGLSGSIPLTIATPGNFSESSIGIISTSETIFSGFNLALVGILFIVVPLVNRGMMPKEEDCFFIDEDKLIEKDITPVDITRPAERLENSRVLAYLIGAAGLVYLGYYFFFQGGGINLNIINFLFLSVAIILHKTPRSLLDSLNEAVKGGAGIIIQFPFYAGIMAVMTHSGLAVSISQGFVAIADAETLPFWSFLSAGVVNMFVPSGGGQWAVQAPVVLPVAKLLNADIARVAMGVAWGDAWTNMIQPFWALPILAIAGLKARDIMGFCLMQLIISGFIISIALTWF